MSALPTDRREYGGVSPLIELRIQQVVTDTRHALRQDIATLGTKVAEGQLQGTKEHAANLVALQEVRTTLEPLVGLPARVDALERSEDIAEAMRKSLWKVGTFVVLVLGATNGIVIAVLSH